MAADIDQQYLFHLYVKGQHDPVMVVDGHCLQHVERAAQGMEPQRKVEGIDLQLSHHLSKARFQIRVLSDEFARLPIKRSGGQKTP